MKKSVFIIAILLTAVTANFAQNTPSERKKTKATKPKGKEEICTVVNKTVTESETTTTQGGGSINMNTNGSGTVKKVITIGGGTTINAGGGKSKTKTTTSTYVVPQKVCTPTQHNKK
jgi:hypothetical protein